MNLQASYFSLTSPLCTIDRLLNPYCHKHCSMFRDKQLNVLWTERAELALAKRTAPLSVEMQIYFSCVIKKRVLFYDKEDRQDGDYLDINERLSITSRAVQSDTCSPEDFARYYPIKRELTSKSARQMHPSLLKVDYKNNRWVGEFSI